MDCNLLRCPAPIIAGFAHQIHQVWQEKWQYRQANR